MKIAILSDTHEEHVNTQKVIDMLPDMKCEALLFCGDFCAPGCAKIMAKFQGKKYFVFGNNDGDPLNIYLQTNAIDSDIDWRRESLGDIEIDGHRIFMTHYPVYAKHAALSGLYNAVFFGHNHIFSIEKIGNTLLLNPGGFNAKSRNIKEPSFAVYDTDTETAIIYDLDGNILETSE